MIRKKEARESGTPTAVSWGGVATPPAHPPSYPLKGDREAFSHPLLIDNSGGKGYSGNPHLVGYPGQVRMVNYRSMLKSVVTVHPPALLR